MRNFQQKYNHISLFLFCNLIVIILSYISFLSLYITFSNVMTSNDTIMTLNSVYLFHSVIYLRVLYYFVSLFIDCRVLFCFTNPKLLVMSSPLVFVIVEIPLFRCTILITCCFKFEGDNSRVTC